MFTREENRKIIFVDVDDTLADTRAAVAALYKEITGDEPLDVRIKGSKKYYEFCPLWEDSHVSKLFRSSKEIYEKAVPLNGAVEGIKYLLDKGYDVRVVTMHSPESVIYKHKWLEKYFPELESKVYYVDWRTKNKDVFNGYAIIDDDIKNIKTNKSNMPILLDYYGIYDGVVLNHDICKTWNEVVKKL